MARDDNSYHRTFCFHAEVHVDTIKQSRLTRDQAADSKLIVQVII